jgi:hypothetical protein
MGHNRAGRKPLSTGSAAMGVGRFILLVLVQFAGFSIAFTAPIHDQASRIIKAGWSSQGPQTTLELTPTFSSTLGS